MSFQSIRVLEIGDIPAVAYCGLQFAWWGADVIVSEEHAGALCRASPIVDDVSLGWTYLTANKRIASDDVSELARDVDVILTNLDRDALKAAKITFADRTILHRILPFARGGMYEGLPSASLLFEAASGYLVINGEGDREPVRSPGHLVSYAIGVHAFMASLAALHKRVTTGETESVETAELDALTTIVPFLRSQYANKADIREGGPHTGVRLFPIGEGAISISLLPDDEFHLIRSLLGAEKNELPDHLDTPEKRRDTGSVLEHIEELGRDAKSLELFKALLEAGSNRVGLYQSVEQLFTNEHLAATNYFKPLSHPKLGELKYPGKPACFGSLEDSKVKLGERRDRPTWHRPRVLDGSGVHGLRPLEGTRIVDFTQAWIGPFASMMLADLGAEVIKVESHRRVDVWRHARSTISPELLRNPDAHPFNISGNFNGTNRNKREIAVDLNHAEGVEIVKDLVATADVVMSNYTPHVMKKFGLDYDSLREVKSDIVCVSWSGYGGEGPYSDYKANGATIEAMSGWDSLFGYAEGKPMVMGFYQTDAITGLQMASCTLLALLWRDLTGEGQSVDGGMLESAIPYIGEEVLKASTQGEPIRWGNRHPDMSPHGVFAAKGEDCWVALVCRDAQEWENLKRVIGIAHNAFDSLEKRRENEEEVEGAISAWTSKYEREEAAKHLRNGGIPAVAAVNSLEILEHPEFVLRDWFIEQEHQDAGTSLYGGFPWRFSKSALHADYPPPRVGEHTVEILRMLGRSGVEIDRLLDKGIVGQVLTHLAN